MIVRSGDVVGVDFGIPQGSEPGFVRPAVIVTAERILEHRPRTVHVVPITSNTSRRMPTEVEIDMPDETVSGLAQVHLCSVISTTRIETDRFPHQNTGPITLAQIRSIIADLLDLP